MTIGVTVGLTWLLFQQGAQTLFSMEKLKNVSFEEEYIKLFPPQPNQPFVWVFHVALASPVISPGLHLFEAVRYHQVLLKQVYL